MLKRRSPAVYYSRGTCRTHVRTAKAAATPFNSQSCRRIFAHGTALETRTRTRRRRRRRRRTTTTTRRRTPTRRAQHDCVVEKSASALHPCSVKKDKENTRCLMRINLSLRLRHCRYNTTRLVGDASPRTALTEKLSFWTDNGAVYVVIFLSIVVAFL